MASPANTKPDIPSEWVTFRDFGGMNRQAIRTSIAKNEFSYLQNLMPVGGGNLQTVRSAGLNGTNTAAITAIKGWSVNLLAMLTVQYTVAFQDGETATGAVSGASGAVQDFNTSAAAATQVLQLADVSAEFAPGEAITGSSGGAGIVLSQTTADWALSAYSDGSLWAKNMAFGPTAAFREIAGAGFFISDVTAWSNTTALMVGPGGYYEWSGSTGILPITSSQSVLLTGVILQRLVLTSVTGTFIVGETVTGGTSMATGVIFYQQVAGANVTMYVSANVGVFQVGETVTGSTSTAHGTLSTYTATPTTFNVGDGISQIPWGNAATGSITAYDPATQTISLSSVTGTYQTNLPVQANLSGALFGVVEVDVSAPPTRGEYIGVFQGRVWVSTGRTIVFSGPNDYTAASWDVALGAGALVIDDQTMKGSITRLVVANGYLYIFAPTSIDIISNVYIPAGQTPPTPVFTRTNINAVVGSPFPQSITIYDRLIVFYNEFGIWALSGVQVEKISSKIDRILQEINASGPGLISAGVGMCNNLLTVGFLVNWYDPLVSTAVSRQVILSFFAGKWFLYDPFNVNPAGTLQCLFSATVDNVPAAALLYNVGIANNLYLSWQSADVPVVRMMQTALWDLGLSVMIKQALKVGLEGQIINQNFNLQAQVDSEQTTSDTVSLLPEDFTWTTPSGAVFKWLTPSNQVFNWTLAGFAYSYSDITQYGRYLGITATGVCGDAIISGANLEYKRRSTTTWELQQSGQVTVL